MFAGSVADREDTEKGCRVGRYGVWGNFSWTHRSLKFEEVCYEKTEGDALLLVFDEPLYAEVYRAEGVSNGGTVRLEERGGGMEGDGIKASYCMHHLARTTG